MTHTLTRRSVTAGLGAAVTAVPAVALCKDASDTLELRALLEAHRGAWRAFEVEVDGHMRDEVRDSYEPAFDAQEELFLQICSYRCGTAEQHRLKAKYLLSCSNVKDFWSNESGVIELLRFPCSEGHMTAIVFTARLWLANRLLDLAEAVAPEEVRAEWERLRRLR